MVDNLAHRPNRLIFLRNARLFVQGYTPLGVHIALGLMIDAAETSLIGRWLPTGSGVVADETCRRIESLVTSHLVELARTADGWSALYKDPSDGRLWEHTYPHSEMHGGGPPTLECITPIQAKTAYGVEA